MSTAELKLDLIKKIIDSNDNHLLLKINTLLKNNSYTELKENTSSVNEPTSTYEKTASEKVYVFNEWQQKRIDIALKQVENGEYLTEEEDEKEMRIWFEEQEKLIGQ